MSYQPNYYDVNVQPIFIIDQTEYPYEGLKADVEATMEYKFIVDTLRAYLGDAVEVKEGYKLGIFEIALLSSVQMEILRDIQEDTGAFPLKRGRSQLRFEVGCYLYDKPPCDANCDCCECLGCCGFAKN
jgi:hypothetical protein